MFLHKTKTQNVEQYKNKIICWLRARVLKETLLWSINAWRMWQGLLSATTTPDLNLIFVKLIELLFLIICV